MKPAVPGTALEEIGNRHLSSPAATADGEGVVDDFASDAAGEADAAGFALLQERASTVVAVTRTTNLMPGATAPYPQPLRALSSCSLI
jgi:hypothetical protein